MPRISINKSSIDYSKSYELNSNGRLLKKSCLTVLHPGGESTKFTFRPNVMDAIERTHDRTDCAIYSKAYLKAWKEINRFHFPKNVEVGLPLKQQKSSAKVKKLAGERAIYDFQSAIRSGYEHIGDSHDRVQGRSA